MKKFVFIVALLVGFMLTSEAKACNRVSLFGGSCGTGFTGNFGYGGNFGGFNGFQTFGFVGGTGQVNLFTTPTNGFLRGAFFSPFSLFNLNVGVGNGFRGFRSGNLGLFRGHHLPKKK